MPKIVAQCRKRVIPYLYTLRRTLAYALPNAFAYLNTCIPYLNTWITYPNTLTRLSVPYLNTCIAYLNTLPRLQILIHALPMLKHWLGYRLSAPYLNTLPTQQPIRVEYDVTRVVSQELSAANQNRVLRHSSRQPRPPEKPVFSGFNWVSPLKLWSSRTSKHIICLRQES